VHYPELQRGRSPLRAEWDVDRVHEIFRAAELQRGRSPLRAEWKTRRKTPRRGAAQLQRGRSPLRAEWEEEDPTYGDKIKASTGPLSLESGMVRPAHYLFSVALVASTGPLSLESGMAKCWRPTKKNRRKLQRGRSPLRAEWCPKCLRRRHIKLLQRGRSPLRAEWRFHFRL